MDNHVPEPTLFAKRDQEVDVEAAGPAAIDLTEPSVVPDAVLATEVESDPEPPRVMAPVADAPGIADGDPLASASGIIDASVEDFAPASQP